MTSRTPTRQRTRAGHGSLSGDNSTGVAWEQLIDLLATCHLQPSAEKKFAVLPVFSLTTRDLLPDLHLVALHGELDVGAADGLTDTLVSIAGSTLVVDLSDLTFIDASGIGALVRAKNHIKADGRGDLVFSRPTAIVRRTLEVVGLDSWIVDWSPHWNE